MPADPSPRPSATTEPDWVPLVRAHVENLRFGLVQLVVHDGRVTQIERTEKVRLPGKGDSPPSH